MIYLTIRNVPRELADRLDEERRVHGRSLNQTVIDLLSQALGVGQERRSNGLGALAGAWSEAEFTAFEEATAELRNVDQELWA